MTLELAIANNLGWYSSIFRAHGAASRFEEHYWSTDDEPPPYHSQLVTRTRGPVAREAQLKRLSELAARAKGRGFSCKDSFDELPSVALENLGLRVLFRAWWYGWTPGAPTPEPETRLTALRVESPDALLAWEKDWRRSSPAGQAPVFPATVLADASLELFTVMLGGRNAGGFALNRSDGAVGLSNVFQVDAPKIDARAFVCECARQARRLHTGRAVVGYGREGDLRSLMSLGFVALGPLVVWAAS